jgi:hypothetical protein
MSRTEQLIVRLDDGAWGAVLRFVFGCLVPPVWLPVARWQGAEWTLFPFFLALLLALRVLPAVARRLVRFSDATRTIWSDRRQLAKRCDSYQWQKLFWIGLGIGSFLAVWGPRSGALPLLAATCVFAGGLGLVVWHYAGAPREGARHRAEVTRGVSRERVVNSAVVSLRGES